MFVKYHNTVWRKVPLHICVKSLQVFLCDPEEAGGSVSPSRHSHFCWRTGSGQHGLERRFNSAWHSWHLRPDNSLSWGPYCSLQGDQSTLEFYPIEVSQCYHCPKLWWPKKSPDIVKCPLMGKGHLWLRVSRLLYLAMKRSNIHNIQGL